MNITEAELGALEAERQELIVIGQRLKTIIEKIRPAPDSLQGGRT